ncbi:MAG: hypothetical protein OXU81_11410 [Gammaproteobacteria bacterium]|nr:hypothetical protein [Gammaproteobacteria bacterium]
MSTVELHDTLADAERRFPITSLLKCEYLVKCRCLYDEARELGLLNPYRNYLTLLTSLSEIYAYNEQHGRSFAKRLRENAEHFKQCEAILAEIIVYRHYIRGVQEGLIRSIQIHESEADVIVERSNGSRMFLEVFSVNPDLPGGTIDGPVVNDIKTHTQDAMSSIRQKLLRKIHKQNQMSSPRENYAVIELNHPTLAGDFAVLSSLSDGYKVQFSTSGSHAVSEGYDWSDSIFDDPATRFLKGIIYFSMGDYSSRKFVMNPAARRDRQIPVGKPFNVGRFLDSPNPKIFDPDRIVKASDWFDVDDFVQTIHDGRGVERKEFGD